MRDFNVYDDVADEARHDWLNEVFDPEFAEVDDEPRLGFDDYDDEDSEDD